MTPQSPDNSKGIRIPRRMTKEELAEQSFEIALPGRKPDEVLGEIRESQLGPGMVMATIATVIAMFAWTGLSMLLESPTKKIETAATVESAPAAKPAATTEASSKEAGKPGATPAAEPQPGATANTGSSKNRELQPPGKDEVKSVPGDVNPLENSADDLLKDLK